MRRRLVLPKHRGNDISGLRQAGAERTGHLLLPDHDASSGSGQGYQILGPYPCDKSFFKYCKSDVANGKTGSTIYVGAPIGTAAALTALLTGKPAPPFNECGSE